MVEVNRQFSKLRVIILLVIITVSGCGIQPSTEEFHLRIGTFSTQDYLPYLVMEAQGFNKQHGLKFQEVPLAGGAAVIKAMQANEVDIGYPGTVPILAVAQVGVIPDIVVPVAANNFADPDHPAIGLLVAPSINGWKDLEGRYIAVNSVDSITAAAIRGRLLLEGVRDFKFVEIDFANSGLALAGGNVAAAGMNEPFLTQSLLRGDGKLLGWVAGGAPFERMALTMIAFRADFYRKNPRAVKAFLRSHLQAVKWIHGNREAARSILTKQMQLSTEVSQRFSLAHWPFDEHNDPAILDAMQKRTGGDRLS